MRGCISPIRDIATLLFAHSTTRMHLLLLVVVTIGLGSVRGNYYFHLLFISNVHSYNNTYLLLYRKYVLFHSEANLYLNTFSL